MVFVFENTQDRAQQVRIPATDKYRALDAFRQILTPVLPNQFSGRLQPTLGGAFSMLTECLQCGTPTTHAFCSAECHANHDMNTGGAA